MTAAAGEVTLRKLLGKDYQPGAHNGAARLNPLLKEVAESGLCIVDPDRMRVRLDTSVQFYSNQRTYLPNTVFYRNFSASGVSNALFTTGPASDDVDFVTGMDLCLGTLNMWGDVATTRLEGHHFKFYAHDSRVYQTDFLNHFKGAATFARGDRNIWEDVRSFTPDLDPGGDTETAAAGFRISKGKYFRFRRFIAIGPNDQAMLVLPMSDNGTETIENCGYEDGYVESYRGKLCTVGASQNGGPVTNFLGGVYKSYMRRIRGKSTRYGVRVVADGSTRKNTIHDLLIENITVALDQSGGSENIDGMQIKGLEDTVNGGGSVGDVVMNNIAVTAVGVRNNGVIDAPGARLWITGYKSNGDRLAMRVMNAARIEMDGEIVLRGASSNVTEGDDGDGGDRSAIKFEDTFTGDFVAKSKLYIEDINTPTVGGSLKLNPGIRAKGGNIYLNAGADVRKHAAASAGTKFARITGAAKLIVGAPITGNVDTWPMDGDGTLVNTSVRSFSVRAAAVAYATSATDHHQLGAMIQLGPLAYVYDGASTSVSDMPGWVLVASGARVPIFGQLTTHYALTSTTALQKLFNLGVSGAITLETGLYELDLLAVLTSMDTTTGNAGFSLLGAGTAALSQVFQHAVGADQGNPQNGTPTTQTGAFANTEAFAGMVAVGGTSPGLGSEVHGMFRVTTAGTIIPSVALTTAIAAQVESGSYIRITRLADSGVNSTPGAWS